MLGKAYILRKSNRKNKRFVLVNPQGKSIHFGSKNGSTYIDHKNQGKKINYIKRHKPNEDWSKINPGSLSRFLLWEKTTLSKAVKNYEKLFNIKIILT